VRGQHGGHRGDAFQIVNGLLGGLAQRLHGGTLARVDLDGEADVAVLDDEAGNHAQADDVLALAGLLNRLQGRQYRSLANATHSLKTPRSGRYPRRR